MSRPAVSVFPRAEGQCEKPYQKPPDSSVHLVGQVTHPLVKGCGSMSGIKVTDEEKIKSYQHMWNVLKMSAVAIGKKFGLNRNSVMGTISRARAAGWMFDTRANVKEKKPADENRAEIVKKFLLKREQQPKTAPTSPKVKPAQLSSGPEITIIELDHHHCKAVIGRSKKSSLPVYCGGVRLATGPYCQQHDKLYMPSRK
jgi:hypothetical protein